PAGERSCTTLLSGPRAGRTYAVGAPRQTVAAVFERELQLPAHGGRVSFATLRTGASRVRRRQARPFRVLPRARPLDRRSLPEMARCEIRQLRNRIGPGGRRVGPAAAGGGGTGRF